jgi:phage host-nuclease inhibitor protein Gam
MTREKKEKEESGLVENLSAVGQMIVGEIEAVGGILTGDPLTRAEGEFNVEVGSLHQESNKVLTAIEDNEKVSRDELTESGKDDSVE